MPTHKHAPLISFIPLSLYFHLLSISPSVGFSGPTKGFVSASWLAFWKAECTLGFIANLLPSIERAGSGAGSGLATVVPGRGTTVNRSLTVLRWGWLGPVCDLQTRTLTQTALFMQGTSSIPDKYTQTNPSTVDTTAGKVTICLSSTHKILKNKAGSFCNAKEWH